MFGTPVTRLVQPMTDGDAKTKTAQANSSSPPTARSIGSRHIFTRLGSLMTRAMVRAAIGSQKETEMPPMVSEASSARSPWLTALRSPSRGSPWTAARVRAPVRRRGS
ncbi:hypothetical protein GCM10010377_26790 [Streptomyces viridiviolaceus]|nr:hypothetical protein GCM10010377_26790 [Streptomyces viridiviolaceus]